VPSYEVVYYEDASGACPIQEFLDSLPPKAAAKCARYIDLLEERGFALPAQFAKKVQGEVWELRPELSNVEYRLFYGRVKGRFFVVAHAIVKKGQKLNPGDIARAESRIREVQVYYETSHRGEPPPVRER
jgi:phage-related protein